MPSITVVSSTLRGCPVYVAFGTEDSGYYCWLTEKQAVALMKGIADKLPPMVAVDAADEIIFESHAKMMNNAGPPPRRINEDADPAKERGL